MTTKFYYQLLVILFLPLVTVSQSLDNLELKKMYEDDQAARATPNIDWMLLNKNDSIREKKVYEFIKEGKITTGNDFYHSAMIFQHGKDSVAYGMAVKHMKKAIELDSTINRWLLAAAIDRELSSRNMPQIYGTQFVKKNKDAKWEQYPIDTTKVTDKERRYYHVETLAEQKEKVRNMNLPTVSDYHKGAKSIESTISLIKTEIKKGQNSTYNVSEAGINWFGYELMNSGKLDDALKIFRINTELYPKGFNTWDSLGECLLKLNRMEEGLAAYKKSLEIYPGNKSALKVLARQK